MVNANLVAAAIAHVEGFFDTKSLAYRHSNPGNLRESLTTYRTYLSIESGWWHLVETILARHGQSLAQYLSELAANTGNDPATYIRQVCELTGYKPETKIGA